MRQTYDNLPHREGMRTPHKCHPARFVGRNPHKRDRIGR